MRWLNNLALWWQRTVRGGSLRPQAANALDGDLSTRVAHLQRHHAARFQQAERALAAHHLGPIQGVFHLLGRSRQRGTHEWAYVGQRGMILEHSGPHAPQIIPWNHVVRLERVFEQRSNTDAPEDPVLKAHTLHLHSGAETTLSADYVNVLDPYPKTGRFVAAIMPAEAARTVPRFPTLGEMLEQALAPKLEKAQ